MISKHSVTSLSLLVSLCGLSPSLSLSLSGSGRQPISFQLSRLLFSSHLVSAPIRRLTPRARHAATGDATASRRHGGGHEPTHKHTHTHTHSHIVSLTHTHSHTHTHTQSLSRTHTHTHTHPPVSVTKHRRLV